MKTTIDWDKVDWSLPWRAIEEQTGAYYHQVRKEAKDRGIKPFRKHRAHAHPGFLYNWDNVDWGQNNAQITEKLGCSRWAVSLARRKMTNTYSRGGYVYFDDGTPWSQKEV